MGETMKASRACQKCQGAIPEKRARWKTARFCSMRCARDWEKAEYRKRNPRTLLSTGKTGAISELIVAADLLGRGFDVFRAVSQACSCDLAVLREGKLLTIEVRSAKKNSKGGLMYTKARINADHIAVVCENEITYEPGLS